jgi:glucose-1-phosphate thymidylyltransferase
MQAKSVKGVLLCGGMGSRLMPLTEAMNKHMLRVGKMPMLEHPLRKMVSAGIKDIHIVIGGEHYAPIIRYLGSGYKWGARISYSVQDKAGGIAQAVGLAEPFIGQSKMLVLLGDNVFNMQLRLPVKSFGESTEKSLAYLFSVFSDTPERFGVLSLKGEKAVDVVEKPTEFVSNWILAGIYLYTSDVFNIIKTLKPSKRGELEISDVNRVYLKTNRAKVWRMPGEWTDCGTFETLNKAEEQVTQIKSDIFK